MCYIWLMADTLTIRWTADQQGLAERLDRVAKSFKRPKADLIRESIAEKMDEWEYEADILDEVAAYRRGEIRTYTTEEICAMHGIEIPELTEAEKQEILDSIE